MNPATQTYRYSRLRIRHFDAEVSAIAVGRAVYFPVKAICQAVGGLAPQSQIARLREDGRTAPHLRSLPVPTIKGVRETVCIRRQEVSIWLASIDISKCAIADVSQLAAFQRELFAAADRFLMGDHSDVVSDGPTAIRPVSGKLRLGDCPRCGLALCLEVDETGTHLRAESEE